MKMFGEGTDVRVRLRTSRSEELNNTKKAAHGSSARPNVKKFRKTVVQTLMLLR